MLFATKQKVEQKIAGLMRELEHLDSRIRAYEDQQKIVGAIFGPAPEIAEMRGARDDIYGTLGEALTGLRMETIDFREIAPQLKPLSGAIAHMRSILDQADADSAKGHSAFKARFGS
ncbi:MAG: hypothetical protein QOG13_2276 [Sphingomonadales bacterium]|jgi:hypothetical protein|nr:hypothetical protein [Sphingomonadales bacterium]